MKKITLLGIAGLVLFAACGESAEEKAKKEKAKTDSIAKVVADSVAKTLKEQQLKDSITAVNNKFQELFSIAEDKYKKAKEDGYLIALEDAKTAFEDIKQYITNEDNKTALEAKISEITTTIENHPETMRAKLREKEEKNPLDYLKVSKSDENVNIKLFHAPSVTIKGKIHNTASVATYKDIEYSIVFYTKTHAVVKTINATLYEYLEPNSKKNISKEIRMPNLDSWDTWDIIINKAVPDHSDEGDI